MNKAHRLATWLEKLATHRDVNANLGTLAGQVLGVPIKSSGYYRALCDLQAQYEELKQAYLGELEGARQQAIFSRALSALDSFFDPAQLGQHSVNQLKSRQDDIDHLFVISEQMVHDEEVTEQAAIDAIVAEAQELLASLTQLPIDKMIKLHLARLIDVFILSVRCHEVFGIEGISSAFGGLASEIARVASSNAAAAPEAKSWTTKTAAFIKKVGGAVVWTGSVSKGGSEALEAGGKIVGLIQG